MGYRKEFRYFFLTAFIYCILQADSQNSVSTIKLTSKDFEIISGRLRLVATTDFTFSDDGLLIKKTRNSKYLSGTAPWDYVTLYKYSGNKIISVNLISEGYKTTETFNYSGDSIININRCVFNLDTACEHTHIVYNDQGEDTFIQSRPNLYHLKQFDSQGRPKAIIQYFNDSIRWTKNYLYMDTIILEELQTYYKDCGNSRKTTTYRYKDSLLANIRKRTLGENYVIENGFDISYSKQKLIERIEFNNKSQKKPFIRVETSNKNNLSKTVRDRINTTILKELVIINNEPYTRQVSDIVFIRLPAG